MEPWYKVTTPRAEVREGRSFNPDEFAIALEQVSADRGPDDHRKPEQFFVRICLTRALKEHMGMVLRRLAGRTKNSAPVMTLVTQFGGGKTYTPNGAFHVAKHGSRVKGNPSIQQLLEALLGPAGQSDPELRRAVFQKTRAAAGEAPTLQSDELRDLVKKIDQQPWLVADDDFLVLRQAGYSEDQIFELTVATAVGAGVRRFEAGLRAIAAAGAEKTNSRHRDHEFATPQAGSAEDTPGGGR